MSVAVVVYETVDGFCQADEVRYLQSSTYGIQDNAESRS